jgi:uncharacterized protein YcfJ
MRKSRFVQFTAAVLAAIIITGCAKLPGSKEQQGAVIGGATGAAAGAVVGGEKHRGLGVILGGVLGAAGGYVIGANSDKIMNKDGNEAETAGRRAQDTPATVEQVRTARTADVV